MLDVIESIKKTAATNQLAPALISAQTYLTYGELLDRIARISNYLADRRVPRRSKVYINIADPNLRLVVILACMHYGLIPFVLVELKNVRDAVDYDFVIGAPRVHAADVPVDIMIDQSLLEGKLADGRLREFPELADDDILFVGSTTGTTGRRKLIAQLYGGWKTRNEHRRGYLPSDRVMFTLGDVTQYGFVLSCYLLGAGAAIVRKAVSMQDNLKMIVKFSVSQMITTPSALDRLMDAMESMGVRAPSVKDVSITGSLFHTTLVQRFERLFDGNLRVGYGTSEMGRISSGVVKASTFRLGYVGELWPNVKVISAGTAKEPAAVTIVNDRSYASPYYSKGKVVANEAAFHTLPDLGYLDGHSLYLAGRDDEVFNLSGNKFPFSAIESAVRGVPGVRDVAVVGAAAAGDPVGLIVGVVADEPLNVAAVIERIVGFTKLRLAEKHVRVVRVNEIVRNDMGKVDRGAVIEAYSAQRRPSDGISAATLAEPVGHA